MKRLGSARLLGAWSPLLVATLVRCAPQDVVLFELPASETTDGGAGGRLEPDDGGVVGEAGGFGMSGGRDTGAAGTPWGGAGAGGARETGGSSGAGAANTGGKAGSGGAEANGGVGGTKGETVCVDDVDCPVSWECQRRLCGDELGICEPHPIFCDPFPLPVCGCDGVTYWNDCVRRQGGAPAGTPGECRGNARECMTGEDCGVEGATCPHLFLPDEPCSPSGVGTCWSVPVNCDPAADPRGWVECPNGGQPPMGMPLPGPLPCVDTCAALRSDASYFLARPKSCE